jgi:FKBP-type peptidyl-prolyl cis-trans isomerase
MSVATTSLRTVLVAAALSACVGSSLPRQTRASNARSDDPWLEGERCAADSQDGAGIRSEDLEAGTGRPIDHGDTVRVHYVATLPGGGALHSTRDGGLPIEIMVGSTKTICGFEQALIGMKPGGQRRVTIPWRLAFGENGRAPDVPPRTDLVFVIDLYLPADAVSEHGSPPVNPVGRGRGR